MSSFFEFIFYWIFQSKNSRDISRRDTLPQVAIVKMDAYYIDIVKFGISDASKTYSVNLIWSKLCSKTKFMFKIVLLVIFAILWCPYNVMELISHILNEHESDFVKIQNFLEQT